MEKERFKVTPRHIQYGYTAPHFYVDASNESEAETIARKYSGLGRFDSWLFVVN